MRADDWKGLCREKGWLKAKKIVPPNGYRIGFRFGESNLQFSSEDIVEVSENFIVMKSCGSSPVDWYYFHWENISYIRLFTKKD